jgi:hypothetical protein
MIHEEILIRRSGVSGCFPPRLREAIHDKIRKMFANWREVVF